MGRSPVAAISPPICHKPRSKRGVRVFDYPERSSGRLASRCARSLQPTATALLELFTELAEHDQVAAPVDLFGPLCTRLDCLTFTHRRRHAAGFRRTLVACNPPRGGHQRTTLNRRCGGGGLMLIAAGLAAMLPSQDVARDSFLAPWSPSSRPVASVGHRMAAPLEVAAVILLALALATARHEGSHLSCGAGLLQDVGC